MGIDAEGAPSLHPADAYLIFKIFIIKNKWNQLTRNTGDFVAMMQGGALDPQRALDAVAQVTLPLLLIDLVQILLAMTLS